MFYYYLSDFWKNINKLDFEIKISCLNMTPENLDKVIKWFNGFLADAQKLLKFKNEDISVRVNSCKRGSFVLGLTIVGTVFGVVGGIASIFSLISSHKRNKKIDKEIKIIKRKLDKIEEIAEINIKKPKRK